MRILLLVDCYLPSTKSSAALMHDLATELAVLGHVPVVVAPEEADLLSCREGVEQGIRVLRIGTGKIKTASKTVRALNELRLSATLWHRGRRFFEGHAFDAIIYYSPTIFLGSLVARLKELYGCRAYLILRDIFPQWAVDAGVMRKGVAYRFFKAMELRNYSAADIIGVQSPANLEYFQTQQMRGSPHLEVLYNWMRVRADAPPGGGFRQSLQLDSRVVFFYGGNIGVAQDMDNILRLAQALRDERSAAFLLVGEGSEFARVKTQVSDMGLSNMIVLPAVDQQTYLSMVADADVGLISLDRRLRTHNFPGKMLSYMHEAKPILASINPGNDLKAVLEEHEAGFVCLNGEDKALEVHARRLVRDLELRGRLGHNGRKLLEATFSANRAATQIVGKFSH